MSLFIKQPAMITASALGLVFTMSGYANAATPVTSQVTQVTTTNAKTMPQQGKQGINKDKRAKQDKLARHMANLDLTDAQKTQVTQLHTQHQAQTQQLRNTLQQYDANIDAQKKAGANTTTLLNLYKQKQAELDKFMTLRQQQQQQFLNILTPEQQLKLFENRAMMQGEHGRGMDAMKPRKPQR